MLKPCTSSSQEHNWVPTGGVVTGRIHNAAAPTLANPNFICSFCGQYKPIEPKQPTTPGEKLAAPPVPTPCSYCNRPILRGVLQSGEPVLLEKLVPRPNEIVIAPNALGVYELVDIENLYKTHQCPEEGTYE